MAKTVEFFFDVGSPTAYLAHKRLPQILARTGAEAIYMPMLLGGVFKATGNAAPGTVPAKGRYMGADLQRFARRFATPFAHNPHFPINTLHLMRAAAGLQDDPRFMTYVDAIFEAMWMQPRNLGDPAELEPVLVAEGFDPVALAALVERQEVKDRLKANTELAVARGAFGAPTFFVGDEMFFGQDRLDFVEEALAG